MTTISNGGIHWLRILFFLLFIVPASSWSFLRTWNPLSIVASSSSSSSTSIIPSWRLAATTFQTDVSEQPYNNRFFLYRHNQQLLNQRLQQQQRLQQNQQQQQQRRRRLQQTRRTATICTMTAQSQFDDINEIDIDSLHDENDKLRDAVRKLEEENFKLRQRNKIVLETFEGEGRNRNLTFFDHDFHGITLTGAELEGGDMELWCDELDGGTYYLECMPLPCWAGSFFF